MARLVEVSRIVVHCTDTPTNREVTWADLHQWHVVENGWSAPGYHMMIDVIGRLTFGPRSLSTRGAHVAGYNAYSLGLVMVGRDYFNTRQWVALEQAHDWLSLLYPQARWCGHRDLDPHKTCPGFDVRQWITKKNESTDDHRFDPTFLNQLDLLREPGDSQG